MDQLSPEELLSKGELLLAQKKFQSAIPCFKQLLKNETSERALIGIEAAYRGRIAELAAKNMVREAFALLQTLEQRCPETDVTPIRLLLLLQSAKYGEAAGLYTTCHQRLPDEYRHRIEPLLGAMLLADTGLAVAELPAESPVARFHPQAMAALELFFVEEEEALQDALRQIPFRSPYRDLRFLLAGLHQLEADNVKAGQLLAKIGEDSPYFRTAASYLAAISTPQDFFEALAAVPLSQRQQFRELHEIPQNKFKALEDLVKIDDSPLRISQFVFRHGKFFNSQQKLALLRSVAPFCGIQAVDLLDRVDQIPLTEKIRLVALAAENDDAPSIAVQYWEDYLEHIDHKDTEKFREIALVIRRKTELMQRVSYDFSWTTYSRACWKVSI